MSRTIICTAGISIASGCRSLGQIAAGMGTWDIDAQELSQEIEERLKQFDLGGLSAPTEVSTEINSLLLLNCSSEDEVVLLVADDAVGQTCAEHLASAIRKRFKADAGRCKVIRIPQLQVQDPERFKREGLPHLFEVVLGYLRDPQRRYAGGVILNPTGGFKGVVPFLTLLGMLYGARVAYGSRASGQLVSLPPVPIIFDQQVFKKAREALAWAERAGVFRAEQFFSKISDFRPGDDEQFSAFIEVTPDGEAALSPLALLLVQKDREDCGQVLLSPTAAEKLRKMRGAPKSAALGWLQRTGSPTWREGNSRKFYGSDLNVFLEKDKPVRIAGFSRGKDFYVCQFYFDDHNTYDRELARFKRADFQDIESFVPLQGDTFGEDSALESWSDLLAERETWRVERDDLIADKQDFKGTLREAHATLEVIRKEEKRKRDELWARIAELERKLKDALAAKGKGATVEVPSAPEADSHSNSPK